MLNGQVFSNQLFESHIFALFINTFLDGYNGVATNYKNGMALTYSGTNVTIDTGAVCIQGRFLEEDAGTTIDAGNTAAYCRLVIQIDLDKTNTTTTFNQGSYEIISDVSDYPALTQQDIVNTNSGVYQYELARFQISGGAITNFQDVRTFLDIEGLYDKLQTQYATDLTQLQNNVGDISNLTTDVKTNIVDALNDVNSKAVISRDENSNGIAVKFYDGTMICTKTITVSCEVRTASGSLYVGSAALGLMPGEFTGVPNIQVSINNTTSAGWIEQVRDSTARNFGNVRVMRATQTDPGGYPYTFKCLAIGKWN